MKNDFIKALYPIIKTKEGEKITWETNRLWTILIIFIELYLANKFL